MATKKGRKIILLFLLPIIGAGVWWKFFRSLKDKMGNTFRIDRMGTKVNGNYPVLVNGKPLGHLLTIERRSDGLMGGVQESGVKYYFDGSSWSKG